MHQVPGPSVALGTDHGRAFANSPKGFSEIPSAADERHLESMFVNVMRFIGRSKYLGFVDVIHAQLLQDLCFSEVTYAAFRHNRNRNSLHDLADLLGGGHAGHATPGAALGGHALQSPDRHRAALLAD